MAALGQMKQKQQDDAAAERAQILGKTWNRLPGDAPRSEAIKQQIDSSLSQYSDKDFNDPQVRANWYKTKVDLVNKFGPNGEIGAQEANYNAYKEYEKNILAKSKELGWSQDELQSHLNQAKNSFKTLGDDGSLNNFQGKGLADYVDPNKWASDAIKDVADDTGITQLRKYGSLNEVTDAFAHGEINHKDYNKIMNSLSMRALGDEKLKSSLEQQGLFRGQQGWSNFIKGRDKDGNFIPNSATPFGKVLSGVAEGAKFRKAKEDYMQVQDPWDLWMHKKAATEAKAQQDMQFSIQGIPTDPNNPTNNDAGINQALKTGGNPLANSWEIKDGKLVMKDQDTKSKQIVNIGGKEYDIDNLPKGYEAVVDQGTSYTPGGIKTVSTQVKGPDGKLVPVTSRKLTSDDAFNAFKDLHSIADRLGVVGDREQTTKAVENYLTTAHNFQMNFAKFDEGTIPAVSKAFGAGVDKEGNITNPGQLSFVTMKTLDGKPINEKDLTANNAVRLNHARILGPAQSLTNSNYEAGDMYVQSTDGSVYIINSNNKTINNALAPATKLTQSLNTYVNTGHKDLDKSDEKKLAEIYPGNRFVSSVVDNHGNHYYGYVKSDKDGNVQMGTVKVDANGTPTPMGLDEATKQITETNMKDILPTYDSKNFDRAFKATELDTEDSNTEQ